MNRIQREEEDEEEEEEEEEVSVKEEGEAKLWWEETWGLEHNP